MISVEFLPTTVMAKKREKMTMVKLLLLLLQAFWPWLYMTLVLVPVPQVWFFQEIFERNKEKYYEEAAESKEDR